MKYGPIVAKRYKKQYCDGRKKNGWKVFPTWEIQPEKIYTILLELKSKRAIDNLLGNDSWTRRLPKALGESEK